MPALTRDVTLLHRVSKAGEPVPVELRAGAQVKVLKEWAEHYLIRVEDGKVFNVRKEFVDPSA